MSRPESVKFLCSQGGNILPRPADGRLRYTGGDTRLISLHRHVTFHELMNKVTSMSNGEMILKYQLTPEDFEMLVTVKSDEDVRHMMDECDRHEHVGGPRLRAFLFPANPIVMGTVDRHSLEQRYINSINGIVAQPSPVIPLPVNTSYTTFSMSSACSSPRTPPETTTDTNNPESTTCHGGPSSLPRARSSSSLCNQVAAASPNLSQNHHHQQSPQPHPHHLHQQPYQPPKPPLDRHPHKAAGPEHLGRMRSTGVAEYYRQQTDHTASHSHGTNRGGQMYYQRGPPYDAYYDGDCRYDRTDSPPSPDVPSSSHSIRPGR
ncbi:hypothetical protein M8C21_023355 [Ambrosia artemisiifolia]|uniref:PB1 domain-containing protein n=1 Tax=Ambrosia artemisiifolia TaxID=4212 RepID=A0AAD5G3Z4_AMBAR|nr:hypothetical protein M8C21_023355 [Ambrosia artemisiifolia]